MCDQLESIKIKQFKAYNLSQNFVGLVYPQILIYND